MMILTLLLTIFLFAILVIGHEYGHYFMAVKNGFKVDEFGFGLPPRLFGKKIKGTLFSINAIPLGGFVKIKGLVPSLKDGVEEPVHPSYLKRFLVFIGGVTVNFIIGWIAFSILFMIGTSSSVYISEVLPNSPANIANLKAGDMIVNFKTIESLVDTIKQSEGKDIVLDVLRGNEQILTTIAPQLSNENVFQIGVALEEVQSSYPKSSLFQSVVSGFKRAVQFTQLILQSLWEMIVKRDISNGSGPVGLFKAVSTSANLGFVYVIHLLAVVSINLAVFNILPLPALDGGYIALLAIEKIRGKKFDFKTIAVINSISFALLFILMIIFTIKDIM